MGLCLWVRLEAAVRLLGSLGSLFTDGWAVIPPGLLFALGLLCADEWGRIFPKLPPPEKGTLLNIPKSFASSVLSPQQATFTPVFSGGPPRTAVRSDPDSYGDFALPWDPVSARESLCAPFQNGISVSPSPVELLHTSPTGLRCQMLWGLFLPIPDPQMWGPEVGLRTLTPVGASL